MNNFREIKRNSSQQLDRNKDIVETNNYREVKKLIIANNCREIKKQSKRTIVDTSKESVKEQLQTHQEKV